MATYAIGDLQGCHDVLLRLLDALRFDPAVDRLWLCGDLVNRGGQSLETLKLLHELRERVVVTLGNHDLSLLAIAGRKPEEQRRVNPDLQRVLFDDAAPVLLDWLRRQKLLHVDHGLGFAMVHAGLMPRWTLRMAEARAREVEAVLQGEDGLRLLKHMYGDKPNWSPRLAGIDRWRAIINAFTRLRYCTTSGRIAFEEKGRPGTQKAGLYPWFSVPGHAERELPVVFGHWSTLGLFQGLGVHGIDTGAVWGGKLTALELGPEPRVHQVPGRSVSGPPRGED
ncbi:symmetrical bis(5'-nucleosyl)-tetraphosphatase [Silanimonas sp.]|uniref:symmetrical bis(5'-nucleosyl)-tetraphosphatase n=1 Tax=Silanimonas sp. TaxID=1929290 RepID=UPI001BBF1554|nr:symmetrical bis(5'-nucleosyl)-tetraphosphatase [Silanimonas sp.]MBS3897098.1 symmetrical bis(5'-nucleosyl)-tetraphosphatase [Silanimonas sp.]MBS3923952.1 symmetrical bis(5'-nucleosyl)-tetraphosphatase [Xanthomonadaceae bacterium]